MKPGFSWTSLKVIKDIIRKLHTAEKEDSDAAATPVTGNTLENSSHDHLVRKSTGAACDLDQAYTCSATENAEYASLVTMMYAKLPQELLDTIVDILFESAFCPGVVFPQQKISSTGTITWEGKRYDKIKPQLLSVSKTILAKYQMRMWKENTFVIGIGDASKTTAFLGPYNERRYMDVDYRPFQKVYLRFTYKDHVQDWMADMPHDKDNIIAEDLEPYYEPRTIRNLWRSIPNIRSVECVESKLLFIWTEKSWDIINLPFDEVTLDFTECYGPRGNWLGDKLAMYMPVFIRKLPAALNIVAPDKEKREGVSRKILVDNVL
ncbi:MAG: hypothetical protein L6R38_005007 [Xanthoria sp. 2 TBL-2021]|nr:MAG: hypothetical protein L6R38_005007 [Xanthoria sp. 2 TBL-2021]